MLSNHHPLLFRLKLNLLRSSDTSQSKFNGNGKIHKCEKCFWGGFKNNNKLFQSKFNGNENILLVRCFWGGCKRRPPDHLSCSTLALSQVLRLRWLSISILAFQSIFVTFNTYLWLSIHICDFQSIFVTFNPYSWLSIHICDFQSIFVTFNPYSWLAIHIRDFQYLFCL